MVPSICFVALKGYAVLSQENGVQHIGGAEVQQALLGRELARRGYGVTFVVLDHGQDDGIEIDGIRVYKAYKPDSGIRGLRFLYPRVAKLWAAMTRANADVYYQRGAGVETGLVSNWCHRNGRRFVFALAHDRNCDSKALSLPARHERLAYRYGIMRADKILTQTETQSRLLERGFGLKSTIVRSCCDLDVEKDRTPLAGTIRRSGVLWVGRFSPEKRPDWVVSLASDLPALRVTVVGQPNSASEDIDRSVRALARMSNVNLLGYVPHARMRSLYREALCLLCTSESEGFPNTFLEAWSVSTPVITTVDPDQLVSRHALGYVASTYSEIKSCLSQIDERGIGLREAGIAGQRYVAKYHGVPTVADGLASLLQSLCR